MRALYRGLRASFARGASQRVGVVLWISAVVLRNRWLVGSPRVALRVRATLVRTAHRRSSPRSRRASDSLASCTTMSHRPTDAASSSPLARAAAAGIAGAESVRRRAECTFRSPACASWADVAERRGAVSGAGSSDAVGSSRGANAERFVDWACLAVLTWVFAACSGDAECPGGGKAGAQRCLNGATPQWCSIGGGGGSGDVPTPGDIFSTTPNTATWQSFPSCEGPSTCVMLPDSKLAQQAVCSLSTTPVAECAGADGPGCFDGIPVACSDGFPTVNNPARLSGERGHLRGAVRALQRVPPPWTDGWTPIVLSTRVRQVG